MPYLKLPEAEIYYEAHGDGPPLLFCSVTGLDHQVWKIYQVPEFFQTMNCTESERDAMLHGNARKLLRI